VGARPKAFGSAAARLQGLRVRTPLGHRCLPLVSVLCCQVEVFAWCWSPVQRSTTECGVPECDREASTMRRPWPTRGCRAIKKKSSKGFWKVQNSSGFHSLAWLWVMKWLISWWRRVKNQPSIYVWIIIFSAKLSVKRSIKTELTTHDATESQHESWNKMVAKRSVIPGFPRQQRQLFDRSSAMFTDHCHRVETPLH